MAVWRKNNNKRSSFDSIIYLKFRYYPVVYFTVPNTEVNETTPVYLTVPVYQEERKLTYCMVMALRRFQWDTTYQVEMSSKSRDGSLKASSKDPFHLLFRLLPITLTMVCCSLSDGVHEMFLVVITIEQWICRAHKKSTLASNDFTNSTTSEIIMISSMITMIMS